MIPNVRLMDANQQDVFSARKRKRMTQKEAFMEHGKLPPQAVDLEEAILGAIMLESNKALNMVINELSPDVFYKEAHQEIYRAIQNLFDKSQPIDILTVTNELKLNGKLELAGGAFYITQLTSRVASSANIEYHTAIVVQKHLARELIRISSETIRQAFDDENDVFDVIEYADSSLAGINEISVRGGSMLHISDSAKTAIEQAINRQRNVSMGLSAGISTGLQELNEATGGWRNKDLIVLAARPGMGKTAMALKYAYGAAVTGTPVCFYSLEMGDESLFNRLMYSQCDVNIDRYKSGKMTDEDWREVERGKEIISKLPIYIDPNPQVSMRYIRANSRVMAKKGKCGLIIIDYLQLIDVSKSDRNANREQRIAEASRSAKIIAKEIDVPVILLAQMNRKSEDRATKEPELADLRESGAIEQDADMVIFVYRPEYYGIEEDKHGNSLKGVGKLLIRKFRDGATSNVLFRYNESLTKISSFYQTPDYTHPATLNPNRDFEQAAIPNDPNF